MDGKNGELSKVKERMVTETPENGVDISNVNFKEFKTTGEATGRLQESGYALGQSEAATENDNPEKKVVSATAQAELDKELNKTESPASERPKREIKLTKAEKKEVEKRTHSDSMLGPEILGVEAGNKAEEDTLGNAWENEVGRPSTAKELAMKRQEERGASPEKLEAYEKAYDGWREARDKAHKSESDYKKAYSHHVAEESRGWRYYANIPRRMWGLEPKLTPELEEMQTASRQARAEHRQASEILKNEKMTRAGSSMSDVEGVATLLKQGQPIPAELRQKLNNISVGEIEQINKYHRMLPHHLTVSVYNKRKEMQERLLETADKNSVPGKVQERMGRVLGKLSEHKLATGGAVALGAGVLVAYAPIFAARALVGAGVGLLTRGGVKSALDNTYVESAKNNLKQARANLGENYFEKNFEDSDKDMEHLMASVGKREARAKTMATAAGIAVGGSTAYYAGGIIAGGGEGVVTNVPESGGNVTPPSTIEPQTPIEGSMTPPNGAESTTPPAETPEGTVPPQPDDLKVMSEVHDAPPRPEPMVESGATETEPQNTEEPVEEVVDEEKETEEKELEVAEATPVIEHEIVKGETGWKAMKEDSLVLKDMPITEQNKWQVKLWNSLTPEEAIKAGFVKSGGNVDLIYPGETINVSMLDQKLSELMHQNSAGEVPTPTPRPDSVEITEAPENESIVNKLNDSLSDMADKIIKSENVVDVSNLTIDEFAELANRAIMKGDEQALNYFIDQGYDGHTLREIVDTLDERKGVTHPDMTISEYLTATEKSSLSKTPEGEPYGNYQPFGSETPIEKASAVAEAANDNQAVQEFVQNTEKASGGLFFNTKTDVSGTFDKISNLSFDNISQMAANDNLESVAQRLGVSTEGYTRWMEKLQEEAAMVPPLNENETVGQYVTRINGTQAAA